MYSGLFQRCLLALSSFLLSSFVSTAPTAALSASNRTSNWLHNYDIQSCSAQNRESLAQTIDWALLGARVAWQDATTNDGVYIPFFKSREYPVISIFSQVMEYEGYAPRGRYISWFCVTPETKKLIPGISPDPYLVCEGGRQKRSYMLWGSIVLVCPKIFRLPPEPEHPETQNCPKVSGNTFVTDGTLRQYASDQILQGLVNYRLPREEIAQPSTLNDMVALNAHDSYLSMGNYQIYAMSKSILTMNSHVYVPSCIYSRIRILVNMLMLA